MPTYKRDPQALRQANAANKGARLTLDELSAAVFQMMLFMDIIEIPDELWDACHEYIFTSLADEFVRAGVIDIDYEKPLLDEKGAGN